MNNSLEINYYIFDKIEKDEDGLHWGHIGDKFCEVFHSSEDRDTDEELIAKGFAKCDAPGSETFLVSETSITITDGKVGLL